MVSLSIYCQLKHIGVVSACQDSKHIGKQFYKLESCHLEFLNSISELVTFTDMSFRIFGRYVKSMIYYARFFTAGYDIAIGMFDD